MSEEIKLTIVVSIIPSLLILSIVFRQKNNSPTPLSDRSGERIEHCQKVLNGTPVVERRGYFTYCILDEETS